MIIPLENLKKSLTIQTISDAEFPLFKLPEKPVVVDGLVYSGHKLIDDLNQPEQSLGMRRLQSPHKFQQIKKTCWDEVQVIQRAIGSKSWFIDSNGVWVYYNKTTNARLVSHQIQKIVYRDTYSILLLRGVDCPFKVHRPPVGHSWARVLYYKGFPWRIYSYGYEFKKTTNKKV